MDNTDAHSYEPKFPNELDGSLQSPSCDFGLYESLATEKLSLNTAQSSASDANTPITEADHPDSYGRIPQSSHHTSTLSQPHEGNNIPSEPWSLPQRQQLHQFDTQPLILEPAQPNINEHRSKQSINESPFAYTTQVLEGGVGLLASDYLARRWSYSTSGMNPHPITSSQRPWTSSHTSSHPSNQHSHFGQSSSLNISIPPTFYGAANPPPTSSTAVGSSPYGDYSTPNTATRPSTTSSINSSLHQHSNQAEYPRYRNEEHAPFAFQQATPPGTANSFVDDSNPFYYQRQLQTLHEQDPAHSSGPTSAGDNVDATHQIHSPLGDAATGYQPPLSAGQLSLGRRGSDEYRFYDYSTPPSTATSVASSTYYDALSTPQTGHGSMSSLSRHSPSAVYSTTYSQHQEANLHYSSHSPQDQYPSQPYSDSSRPSSSSGIPQMQQVSPYSLIIPNPDPVTSSSRPHLCTHCQETFRRIHDAKRHAFGAMGVKNYACMGGCQMTFKRSEGRARHWMREEVAGVGSSIPVLGVTLGVGGSPIWGGKGCEDRHAQLMSGTMEEDRRLRNKARRERIIMMNAAKTNGTNGSGNRPTAFSATAANTAAALGLTTRNAGVSKPHNGHGGGRNLGSGGGSMPSGRHGSRGGYGAPY